MRAEMLDLSKGENGLNESQAIMVLLKVKNHYSMNRPLYDDVIKWLERKHQRKKKIRRKEKYDKCHKCGTVQVSYRINMRKLYNINRSDIFLCWACKEKIISDCWT